MFVYISFFFLFVFFIFVFFLNFYYIMNFETKTFFECGFDSLQSYRSMFSLRFFNITIIFLIFDMEIVLVLPLVMFYDFYKFLIFFIYIFLMLGLILEWNQGGLDWK